MTHINEKVKEIVDLHIKMVETSLPDFLEAYYIFGSVSLGAFDYGYSDIDFIVVVKREVTAKDLDSLKRIHSDIKKKYPKTDLMGLYLMQRDLQSQYKNEKTCPCFIDGRYKGLQTFEKNSIDAFQLKKYGITIKGRGIETLDYIVDWDILIQNMRENINTYWANWRAACSRFPSIKYIGLLTSLSMVEWGNKQLNKICLNLLF